jgi:hypothetical protein
MRDLSRIAIIWDQPGQNIDQAKALVSAGQ